VVTVSEQRHRRWPSAEKAELLRLPYGTHECILRGPVTCAHPFNHSENRVNGRTAWV